MASPAFISRKTQNIRLKACFYSLYSDCLNTVLLSLYYLWPLTDLTALYTDFVAHNP